jgi:hypothetical protein
MGRGERTGLHALLEDCYLYNYIPQLPKSHDNRKMLTPPSGTKLSSEITIKIFTRKTKRSGRNTYQTVLIPYFFLYILHCLKDLDTKKDLSILTPTVCLRMSAALARTVCSVLCALYK